MTRQREAYAAFYEGDFGLSELTARLSAASAPPDRARALALAADVAALCEGEGAVELGVDAGCLLESPLPDDVIRTAWLAATRHRFDPAGHDLTMREWLGLLTERWPARARKGNGPRFLSRPSVDEESLRATVVREMGITVLPDRTAAAALENVAEQADADLGLRLFLRAVKAYAVPVGKDAYDRLMRLDEQLGYPGPVVYDGLNVLWPPLDTGRRDARGDFGFSSLTAWFAGGWHHDATPEEAVRQAAAADHDGQTPGTQAAFLLEDTLRLLDSPLSSRALTDLWLTATDRGYAIDRLSIDGRDWLRGIADVCRERLREVAPEYIPAPPAPVTEPVDDVLRELHEAGLPHPATAALEQVVSQVDPDLGFRLFLRTLSAQSIPLSEAQYARYRRLAARFGDPRGHLTDEVEQLVGPTA
ncbi:hypothetical protein U5640_17900 [Streptomyces sp. SS7]|uniref:hypothetical protein n=1 Tax=Streptomyces sp. SS7 TaxID=3108485 RepID=UPI0030ED9A17